MSSIGSRELTPEIKRGIAAWIAKAVFGMIFIGALMFACAGRWDWVWGWAFVGLFVGASIVHVATLIPTNPGLLALRSKGIREEGAPLWDKIITSLAVGFLPMASWIVAALDERFGWSPMPPALHVGGAALFALGWAFVLWATVSNAFFATTVRIQAGQTVQTGGPYQLVRHPGYVGGILYQLATPFLLGSWWALVPMVLTVPLFVVRTALEDKLLREQLAGYAEYAARVRCRLVPGLW